MSVEQQIPFMAHLFELRRRLTIAASSWLVAFVVCYYFSEPLYLFISKPLRAVLPAGSKMVFLSPTEPLFTYMKIAAVAAQTNPPRLRSGQSFLGPQRYGLSLSLGDGGHDVNCQLIRLRHVGRHELCATLLKLS